MRDLERQQFFAHKAWNSYEPAQGKRGAVIGVVKKIDRLCSDADVKLVSLRHKLNEFRQLGYPLPVLQSAILASQTPKN